MRIVFVHGAFSRDGSWWWAPVATLLDQAGFESAAVELPSCGEAGTPPTGEGPGLREDTAAATAMLDDGEPTVVVAHSYGGMVASQVGDHDSVRHLVYISSFLPKVGENLATLTAGPNPVPVVPHEDGSVSVDVSDEVAFDARFMQDVDDPDLITGAHERLCPQSAAVFGAEATSAAWERVESTYLVCARDNSTSPETQRAQASRATRSHELAAGHFPMLARPGLVAAIVEEIASAEA